MDAAARARRARAPTASSSDIVVVARARRGAAGWRRGGRSARDRVADAAAMRSDSRPAAMQASVAAWIPTRSSHQSVHGSCHTRSRYSRMTPAASLPALETAGVPVARARGAPRARGPSRRAGAAATRSCRPRLRACSARPGRVAVAALEDDAASPVVEALGALDLADTAHRVGDERAVAEPAEAVGRERRGRPRSARLGAWPSLITSTLRRARRSRTSMSLHGSGEQPLDEVALEGREDDQRNHGREERRPAPAP